VSALMPCERSQGSKSGNRADGNPFLLQFETVLELVFVALANANVPPSASMISEAVLSEFMGRMNSPKQGIVNSQDARDNDSDARKCQVVPLSHGSG
jgi:hypothetical protein